MPSIISNLSVQTQRLVEGALGLLFPPLCAVCGRVDEELCPECVAEFMPVSGTTCTVCGDLHVTSDLCERCATWPPAFSRVQSAYRFEGGVRKAIHALKYENRPALAAFLAAAVDRIVSPLEGMMVLCAVPLFPDRLAERGYNQAELIAEALAQYWAMPCLPPDALRRVRPTASQTGLTYTERLTNVEGAFEAHQTLVQELHILVVDDVCTTGATLASCAGALLSAGAKVVSGVTVARAVGAGAQ